MFLAAPSLHYQTAAFGGLGWPEVIIIVLVVLILFGGKKLPEMARGTGRALRIFKAETKGLMDDDEDPPTSPPSSAQQPPSQIEPPRPVDPPAPVEQPRSETDR